MIPRGGSPYTMKNKYIFPTLFCVCLLLFSNQVFAKDTWVNVKSKNFNLIGNASEKDIRGVATKLEQFREVFRQIFSKTRIDSSIPTNVVVFKSDSAYKPFKPKRADGKAVSVTGYFQPNEDLNYITLTTEGEKEETYGTIFHEYIHFLIETNFGKSDVPPWFNEGLAEYYQTFSIADDQKVTLGGIQQGHLYLLQDNKLMPLKTFFELDNYSLHQNADHSRSIFYAQAWALTHYLIQGNKGANSGTMGDFLSLILKGQPPEKAFQQVFQRDYAAMEKELKKYVEQSRYMTSVLTFKTKLTFDTQMTAVPLSEAEANAYLGDLLYHTHNYNDAEKYLQTALSLDANSVIANTSYGLVKMRQRKFGEAKSYLEKALANDSKNHYVHYNYAFIMSREGMDEGGFTLGYEPEKVALMRQSLQKAIELKPEFSESYSLLAFLNLVSNENLDESLALLKKGLSYQPGNQHYALLEAQILARQEKFTEAKAIAEKLAKTADDQYLRSSAERVLSTITQHESVRNNYQKQIDEINEKNASVTAPTLIKRTQTNQIDREKFEAERKIDAMNRSIKKPETGETQILGSFEKIACPNGTVVYTVKTATELMTFASKDFSSLNLVAIAPEAVNFQVGCNADLKTALAVIHYRPSALPKSKSKGEITSIYFVSNDFRFKTAEEIAAGDAKQNDLAQEDAVTQLEDDIKGSLRKPADGERRELAYPEKIECVGRSIFIIAKSGSETLRLKTDAPQNLRIMAFNQNVGSMQFGCGVKFPNVPAVVTFRPSADAKDKVAGEIVAIEFVPEGFKLD